MKKQIAEILTTAYKRKKTENRRFSMQQIANRLGISLPFTSQIISGKRALPPELIESICTILDVDIERKDFISRSILKSRKIKENAGLLKNLSVARTPKETSHPKVEWYAQPKNNFWILKDWIYLAIMDATLLREYDGTSQFLAKRLSIPVSTVEQAIQKMLEANILEIVDGKPCKKNIFNDFYSQSTKQDIRTYHEKSLEKAKQALLQKTQDKDIQQRLITTYTMTASQEKITWAKQQIATFIKNIAAELAQESADEVYQLSIQFFPLTDSQE